MKNIIFDLGGVILKGHSYTILDKYEMKQESKKLLTDILTKFHDLDYGYSSTKEEYDKCNFPKDVNDKYRNIIIEYYKYRDINMELMNYIYELKKNFHLYILSDNNKDAIDYFKNHKLFNCFDGWVASCDYHTIKKEGKLFDILLDKYDLKSEECFFVDDLSINVEVALKHGIKGFVFNDNINELKERLKNI